MYFVNSYFMIALSLAVIAGIVFVLFRRRNSVDANSRMKRMMLSCGMDEESIEDPEQHLKIDMDAVRTRCQNCPVTVQCERWLNGESATSNSFCPNAWHFTKAVGPRRDPDSMSTWIIG